MITLLFVLFALNPSLAEEEKKVETREFPEWHAVKRFNPEEGFQLRDAAIKSMGVSFMPLATGSSWSVPSSAVARVKYSRGVYRLFEGWITFVLVDVVSQNGGKTVIKSADLQTGDQIAVSGVSELRLTESDLNSDTVDSCAH